MLSGAKWLSTCFAIATFGCGGGDTSRDGSVPIDSATPMMSDGGASEGGGAMCPGTPSDLHSVWMDVAAGGAGVAVTGRRVGPPSKYVPAVSSRPAFADVYEAWNQVIGDIEVSDSLGYVVEPIVTTVVPTGRGFWASSDGTPHPTYVGSEPMLCLDVETQTFPEGDELYLFFFIRTDTTLLLRWRSPITDGMASGVGTLGGAVPVADFRAP